MNDLQRAAHALLNDNPDRALSLVRPHCDSAHPDAWLLAALALEAGSEGRREALRAYLETIPEPRNGLSVLPDGEVASEFLAVVQQHSVPVFQEEPASFTFVDWRQLVGAGVVVAVVISLLTYNAIPFLIYLMFLMLLAILVAVNMLIADTTRHWQMQSYYPRSMDVPYTLETRQQTGGRRNGTCLVAGLIAGDNTGVIRVWGEGGGLDASFPVSEVRRFNFAVPPDISTFYIEFRDEYGVRLSKIGQSHMLS